MKSPLGGKGSGNQPRPSVPVREGIEGSEGSKMNLPSVLLLWVGLVVSPQFSEGHSEWEGTWSIRIGKGGYNKTLDCKKSPEVVVKEFTVTLECPDLATDEYGNHGYWTNVRNRGIEIVIQGRKLFSFSKKRDGSNDTDLSGKVSLMPPGWSHDLLGNNWACFYGVRKRMDEKDEEDEKDEKDEKPKDETPSEPLIFTNHESSGSRLFRTDHDLIAAINQGQSFWKAERYPEFENMTMDQMINMAGGKYSVDLEYPEPGPITEAQRNASFYPSLPKNFDWRNFYGRNFVGPVRNQGRCGSCYAFAATAMYESRLRILTGNQMIKTYSPQDVVDCSPYAFGCDGGYLFGEAKYAEDFGFAEESCSPYYAQERECTSLKRCRRSYATDYEFIGTHTGGCNELAMRLAIFHNGPIVTRYVVYTDFIYYKRGIYRHYGRDWPYGGHVVTVVGWGEDPRTGTKYWIVKNSWGSDWGENGYFQIIRGLNECNFESIAWQATVLL